MPTKQAYIPTRCDRTIAAAHALRYRLIEPPLLQLARRRFAGLYQRADDRPLISVYIPTYNRCELLMERALPSVMRQSYANWELIVVGDCCTDATEQQVRAVGDPRIRFMNLTTRERRYPDSFDLHWLAGPVVAANRALEMVQGAWIARIDDDDIWTPDHLEVLLDFAQREQWEFVSGQHIAERHGVRAIEPVYGALDPYYTRRPAPEQVYNPRIGGTQTWLYRSYLKFFRYNIHCWRKPWNRVNDIDISLRMFQAGVRMGFLPHVVTEIVPRPGEATVGFEAYTSSADEMSDHFSFAPSKDHGTRSR